ncbi:hypothetical protein [Candidatus Mycobacterium methanotrophicum]|uniref:GNAT family N-acetyltransferase n=1 Tax=Candidatus Mycobacterium methanotrophicum TaxID=2943498 RepID=A0ABY4QMG8_9MYCO|nr:hypothetical protein [Candidatus Mycobacterium methanotrophicum]UQX12207.1 hypothetical protein M5I08_07930 [Candidatus Mycobacterium methanotrophicum]
MAGGSFELRQRLSWPDPDIGCTLILSQPTIDPDLWAEFCSGAEGSYRQHGVECALDIDVLRTGADTIMFCAAIDDDGRMAGGLRAIGPLRSPDDSHAVVEWAGQPGEQAVRDMIGDRIPFGVMEMKTGWVADDWDRDRPVTTALARSGFYMATFLGFQFFMATAATYVLNRWRSSGGVVAPIPATPYPDDRYRTKMIWWDRYDFINHAEPKQAARILTENDQLTSELYRRGDLAFTRQHVV